MSRPPWYARPAGRRGLTIIELMIAVAIIGVLSAIAIPQYVGYVKRTELKRTIADIRMLEALIDRYRSEIGALPDDLAGVVVPFPEDAWGNPYEYIKIDGDNSVPCRKDKNLHPLNSDYDLYSRGPDGDTKLPLTSKASRDDIIRANDGAFVGVAEDY